MADGLTATAESGLARVALRLEWFALNANPDFEIDVTNWTVTGGTFVRSTAQFHEGAASGLLTPDGVSALVFARCELVPATVGGTYRARAWVRCAVARSVNISINWRDGGGVLLSTSTAAVDVGATTWTFLEVVATAPASTTQAQMNVSMGTTPPAGHTLHIDEATISDLVGGLASIVRVHEDGTEHPVRNAEPAMVNRTWVGFDHEVPLDRPVTYKASNTDASVTHTSASVTVDSLGKTWLTHPGKPWLNTTVTLRMAPERVMPARRGVLRPLDRADPIVIHSIRLTDVGLLAINTTESASLENLKTMLADGAALLLRTPSTWEAGGESLFVSLDTAERQPLTRAGTDLRRRLVVPFDIMSRPPGASGGTAGYRWDDLRAGLHWDDIPTGVTWDDLSGAL